MSNASQQWAASLNATLHDTNFTQLLLQAVNGSGAQQGASPGSTQEGTSPASAAKAADAAQLAALLESVGPGARHAGILWLRRPRCRAWVNPCLRDVKVGDILSSKAAAAHAARCVH